MTQAATLAQLASSGALSANSSGYVGVGTSSPLNTLDVNGAITMRPSYGTYLVNSYYDGAWKYVDNGVAWGIGNNFGGISNGVTIANAAVNSSGANAALTWTPRLSIDTSGNLQFNSGYGSVATAYGCRAWVNFNGTGTVAIRASGNVSSITDNGTGDYTVNFTTAMSDANYATVCGTSPAIAVSGTAGSWYFGVKTDGSGNPTTKTASACRVITAYLTGPGLVADAPELYVTVFR